jgi:hypothetical protein
MNERIRKSSIKEDNATRRRYTDYAIKRMIKNTINELIVLKKIDPHQPVELILNMDQQSTKSNAYYSLKSGIYEELLYGINNFDYGVTHKPILFSTLMIKLNYLSSHKSYVIQAADLVAGTVRKAFLENQSNFYNHIGFINFKTILP